MATKTGVKRANTSRSPENMKAIATRRSQLLAFAQDVLKETTISEERVKQGLPATVVDTSALAQIAGLLNRRGGQ